MSKLKFGWAEQSITPDKKVSLAGQFAERISEYVEKPICVTALAISSETDRPSSAPAIWSTSAGGCATPCAQSSPGTTQVLTR